MGREARIEAQVGSERGHVHALLEGTELILRGDIARRYPRAGITQLAIDDGVLAFASGAERVRLHLGAAAPAWHATLLKPPPTLREKLGLASGARAITTGRHDDATLAAALGPAMTDGADAAMIVARIDGLDDLATALETQARHPALPVWAVYPKGRGVAFGDAAIRVAMRDAGFRDTKSCAVSDRLTATRWHPPR